MIGEFVFKQMMCAHNKIWLGEKFDMKELSGYTGE
jgi:hypothetical protein